MDTQTPYDQLDEDGKRRAIARANRNTVGDMREGNPFKFVQRYMQELDEAARDEIGGPSPH